MNRSTTIKFYQVLSGELTLTDFEKWIYNSSTLEEEIGSTSYMDLISFDFKDKNATEKIIAFTTELVQSGDFEKWKISKILYEFIELPERAKDLLNDLYDLYCGFPNEDPYEPKGYKFLKQLGLNHLYWIDEDYLKTSYGEKWMNYYKKYEKEIPFYHNQLVPYARAILLALESNEIEIYEKGNYRISNLLKEKFESDKIIELKHKE